jgi:hypothetical protein
MTWLRDCILGGEQAAWTAIAVGKTPDGSVLPAELVALAKAAEGTDPAQLAIWSNQLRRLCAQTPTAAASAVLAATSVLRLSALGHDDPEWSKLIPRWLVPSVDPEIRGLGLLAMALNTRDQLAADDYADLMDEAVRLLPPASPLRGAHLYQYALYLSLRGMLRRLAGVVDLPRPGDQEPEVDASLLAECFYDAVCCGRTGQAAFLERRLLDSADSAWHQGLFRMHRVHIPVFDAILNRQPLPEDNEVPSAPLLRALLAGDRDVLDSYVPDGHAGELSPLLSFDALRVVLGRHDQAAARRLVDARAAGIERHWLDDLFLARLLLLEDKPDEAGTAFARVEASAERYGAVERLEIELRLAQEMSRYDCCRLGMLGGSSARRRLSGQVLAVPRPGETPATDDALLAGGSAPASALREAVDGLTRSAPGRILLIGADDGSRRTIASILLRRLGGGAALRQISARAGTDAYWGERCRHALEESGTLFIDDIADLSPSAQAQLVPMLQDHVACRLIFGSTPQLCAALAEGQWRHDLYWPLAPNRLRIPELNSRSGDAPEIVLALLAAQGVRVRWEATARQALSNHPLPGGWAQLQALALVLRLHCADGTIDRKTLVQALASLCDRGMAEGG